MYLYYVMFCYDKVFDLFFTINDFFLDMRLHYEFFFRALISLDAVI